MVRMLLILLLSTLALHARGASLCVQADHNPAEVGDVVTLDVTLDGLDLTDNAPPDPDFTAWLGEAFELLATNRTLQVTDSNGHMGKQVQWSLQVLPRHSGTLVLPPLALAGARSKSVTLKVTPMPEALRRKPDFLFTSRFEPASPYVHQMGRYTVRLLYRGELVNGIVSPPAVPDARLERLSDQLVFRKVVDDTVYTVYEWRYALFPQKAGSWTLPPQTLTGQLYVDRRLSPVQARTPPIRVKVRPVPDQWPSGHSWLPVRNLTLSVRWADRPKQPHIGDTMLLEATLTAHGIRGAQLPDLTSTPPAGLRLYADPPEIQTFKRNDDLVGEKTLRWLIFLEKPGDYTLPAIRLPWWDVNTDRLRWAELPAQTFHVADRASPAQPEPVAGVTRTAAPAAKLWPWQLATALLALSTLILAWMLWRRHRHGTRTAQPSPSDTPATRNARQPCALPPMAFYQWLLREGPPHLKETLPFRQLEAALFHHSHGKKAQQAQAQLCQHLTRSKTGVEKTEKKVLNDLYPS